MDDLTYARFFYLVKTLNYTIPRNVMSLIPGGHWIQSLTGLLDPRHPDSSAQAVRLYQLGASLGPASASELSHLLLSILEMQGTLTGAQWIEVAKVLSGISSANSGLQETILPMSELSGLETVERWPTGFLPLDAILGGGITPGIYLVIGAPGSGKSSLMMMLAEALAISLPETSPLLYVQTEMPPGSFKARIAAATKRGHFREIDTLVCAPWDTTRIIEKLSENPNPDTIVIFDSPDPVLLAGEAANVRFQIAQAWLDFIRIKQSMAKTIFVTSWSRRGTANSLSLESGAEGAAKERYSDVVLGLINEGPGVVRLECYKNRYGQPDLRYAFAPDWADLTINQVGNRRNAILSGAPG